MSPSSPPLIEACPLGCASALEAAPIALPEGPLRRCASCALLVSSCTRAQYEASLAMWDTESGTQPDASSADRFQTTARRRLARARQLLPKVTRPRLLDVGCSSGSLLGVAAEMGFDAVGVESAPAAAASARRAGFSVVTGRLQDADFAPGSFDVITLIEVLEHLTDPLGLLRACHRLLRPDGIVLIDTPNPASWTARMLGRRWLGFSLTKLGGHICFYSPHTLGILADRSGFDRVSIATRHLRFAEPGELPAPIYRLSKLVAEMLAMPARWLGGGHDLLAILRRRD